MILGVPSLTNGSRPWTPSSAPKNTRPPADQKEPKLVGGIEALSRLADRYATSRNITHHAEMVRRTATIRNLVIITKEIAEEGMGDLESPDESIDQAEKRVLEVNERGRKTGYVSSRDLLIQVFNQISERAKRKNPITGVPTGTRG